MLKRITFVALAVTALVMCLAICTVCAADISVSSDSSQVTVPAAENNGIEFDINGFKTEKNEIYLFLPADADASKLTVSFGGQKKTMNLSSEKNVVFSDGTFKITAMQSKLPTLYFIVDESQGTIEAMNSDPGHKTKCFGTFYLDVPEKLAKEKGWASFYTDAASEIKGRGNATWGLAKKAYQIKLDKKQSILEMGKDKTWIILANHGDRSLIRNKLAYDFAKDLGLEYSLDTEFVDVFFNGDYQGNYLLTEKVEVGKQRVDIYDLEEKDENPDADRLTGGYLIEYDRLAEGEITWFKGEKTGRLLSVKSPEEATPEQKQYISELVNDMEKAIYSQDGVNEKGKHYSDYMDVDSFIKLYWINEIFKNGDFFWGSTFMYKDVGADEKLYSGPAWDYDITLANACNNAGAATPARQSNLATPLGWWARTVADGFTKYLFNHKDFRLRNKEVFDETVCELLLELPEKAEEYYEYVKESADMNFVRWNVLEERHQWETPNTATTYRGEVDFVKNYLEKRAEWIETTMNGAMATSNLGTEFNPIEIASSEDLKKLRDTVNGGESCMGFYFIQTADIDLGGEEFTPIGTNPDGFIGNYNGNGYSIKNLKITDASVKEGMKNAGLFANINGGEVSNVTIESGMIDVSVREVGAIAGRAVAARIYNCINKADVINRYPEIGQMTGGIVGYFAGGNSNYLVNCANIGNVSGIGADAPEKSRGIGGIAGQVGSGCAVSGCINTGKVTAGFGTEGFVGGIVGELSGRRPRVSNVYWLTGEDGNENGHGYNVSEEAQTSFASFNGMGITKEEINSEKFAYEMNKSLVSISTSGGTSYVNLKMWKVKDGNVLPAGELATLEKLPRILPEWVFSNRTALMKWSRSVSGAKLSVNNDGTINVKPEGRDPILSASLEANETFIAEEYKYVAVKMKVKSTVDNGAIFFGTDKHPGPKSEHYSKFSVINDGYWHDYIINMSEYSHNLWHGNVYLFRFDPINAEDLNAQISIERIGIFKSSEEAQAFLDASPKNVGFLTDSIQKVIIPENIGDFKATQDDFMLKNNKAGARPNERAQIVVVCVDNGGNENVIPICYTDSKKFTTYMAVKPGNYKLTYRYKEYTDTNDHWATEYIDFSSARGLFAGTTPTEFSPDQTMTRGMFITVLGRMHGADTSLYDGRKTGYDDIKGDEYYASYVGWAAQNGILKTFEDRSFYADTPISRKDMAIMLYRYVQNFATREAKEVAEEIVFNDISSLGGETVDAISTIQKYGIINGKGEGRFDPFGYSTRAEVATVMTRLIKSILGVIQ